MLFDSGSDALRPEGRLFLERIGPKLETLLEAEPGQMVLVGGHTDDRALRGNARLRVELGSVGGARARRDGVLIGAGLDSRRIVAAGFGAEHPRARQRRRSRAAQEPPHRSPAGPHGLGGVAVTAERLSAPLLRLASRVLGDLPPAEALEAVGAVRAFAAGPSPARYLTATRLLRHAERRHKLGALGRVVGHRRTEHSLDLSARGGGLAPELMHALRALPADARNGRRVSLISELLAAYRLIEARTSGALLELRRSLGPLPLPTATERRRRQGGSR